ncbi:hypothetical protein V5T82_05310 [Magnetovibrio sp. PR-2]|uniref:hypothetical protein n=1 Tax=Magnetovibrio sp. PR-2 TaxID=3120356 RepID=UPI002FCE0EEF
MKSQKDKSLSERIGFYPDLQVMEIDLSELMFSDSSEVNHLYDAIETRVDKSNQKWLFLINYKNCTILPDAWIAFAHRGKKLNLTYSLGTVRYAIPDRTSSEILEKSKEENFDPNMFDSREEALEALAKMRADLEAKGMKFSGGEIASNKPKAESPVRLGTHFPRQIHVRRHPVKVRIEDENANFVSGCTLTLSLLPGGGGDQVIPITDTAEPLAWYYGTQDRVVLKLSQMRDGAEKFLTAIPFDEGLDEPIDIAYVIYDEN